MIVRLAFAARSIDASGERVVGRPGTAGRTYLLHGLPTPGG